MADPLCPVPLGSFCAICLSPIAWLLFEPGIIHFVPLHSFCAISLLPIAWSLFEQALLCFDPKDPIPLSLSSSFFGLQEDPWHWDNDDFCDDCDNSSMDEQVETNFWLEH